MEDAVNFPGKRGSVAIIDLKSLSLMKYVYTGHQPHGITVNEAKSEVIVVNRNTASGGPAPHHTTACGGRNGYISYINLNTLEVIPGKKVEVSVDPYFVSLRK
jgi:DNA-binding beta-propeller fold protein YncE